MNQLSYQPEDQAAENAFKRKMRPPTSKCEIVGMSSKIHNQQLKCAQNKGSNEYFVYIKEMGNLEFIYLYGSLDCEPVRFRNVHRVFGQQ